MSKNHTIAAGECISSIAHENGFFPDTIWEHPSNAVLKAERKNMNALLPGDTVFVPDKTEKKQTVSTGKEHRFRMRGVPGKLRIRVWVDGKPVAHTAYIIKIDGKQTAGITDGGGALTVSISPNAQAGRLLVMTNPESRYELDLGHLPPAKEISGIKARLNNLGFNCGAGDEMTEETKAAIAAFQGVHGLQATGNLDAATVEQLRQLHDG